MPCSRPTSGCRSASIPLFTNPLTQDGPNTDLARPNNYALNLMGRLTPGLDIQSAVPLLPALAARLDAIQPPESATAGPRELQIQAPSRFSISTSPAQDGPVTAIAVFLIGMAGVVLLIACLNLANMLLARGTAAREGDSPSGSRSAPRAGASSGSLLVEGLLLALAGGVLGLLLAQWSDDLLTESLNGAVPGDELLPRHRIASRRPVLGATLLSCVGATLIFSLGPALKSVRIDLVHDLKQQAGEPAIAGRWNRFFSARHCLVMAQISLSLVLLFSGGLFFRGALNAVRSRSRLRPGRRRRRRIRFLHDPHS